MKTFVIEMTGYNGTHSKEFIAPNRNEAMKLARRYIMDTWGLDYGTWKYNVKVKG
jgi:hypothetical protein